MIITIKYYKQQKTFTANNQPTQKSLPTKYAIDRPDQVVRLSHSICVHDVHVFSIRPPVPIVAWSLRGSSEVHGQLYPSSLDQRRLGEDGD